MMNANYDDRHIADRTQEPTRPLSIINRQPLKDFMSKGIVICSPTRSAIGSFNGYPIGATGAILITKVAHALQRTGENKAVVSLCIGGGQGIALCLERA
jgi:hypothetical protein